MKRTLKYAGIHLWLATLLTIPLNFYVQSLIQPAVPQAGPMVTGVFFFILCLVLLGVLTNSVASKMIFRLVKEGQAWERSGITSKAGKAFMRAIRVYDSFLLLPVFNNGITRLLSGAIAKFSVHSNADNPNFRRAAAFYIKQHPEDEKVVLPWLAQLGKSSMVSASDQEVLSVLSHRSWVDPLIQQLLADIFISLERRDFSARQFYDQLKDTPGLKKKYAARIDDLIGDDKTSLKKPDQYVRPQIKPVKKESKRFIWAGRTMVSGFGLLKRGGIAAGKWIGFLCLMIPKGVRWVQASEKAQFYIKTGLITVAAAGLLVFVANTVFHVLKPKVVENTQQKIQVAIPKPFTIQVAAYLKLSHAQRYVDVLKKKGVDAHIKNVDGGGKIWYLVRVSEFSDKKSAAEFGQKLKQQKIIEDFFVNNK